MMTRAEWLEKHAFSAEGLTWCVFGDNTYAIKDWLKEQGCQYIPQLGWHSAKPLDVPEGYGMMSFDFDDLMQWNEEQSRAFFYSDAAARVQEALREAKGPSLSEHMGVVGERLREIKATFVACRGFSGQYGWTNIYHFKVGENVLNWFTKTEKEGLEPGQEVLLTGTVKKHDEYQGVKVTHLTRCIVKALE